MPDTTRDHGSVVDLPSRSEPVEESEVGPAKPTAPTLLPGTVLWNALLATTGETGATTRIDRLEIPGYEILEEIGRGGMGVVYKARDIRLNRPIALKMILSGQIAGSAEVQRFRREAEAAGHLEHPGIVPVYRLPVNESNRVPSIILPKAR